MTQGKKAVAIIGASESTLWTYWAMRNMDEYGFAGEVWPVNPNRDSVYGTKTFPSIESLPGVPETAILVTNPSRSIQSAEQLVDIGVQELIVVSDGFRETATAEGQVLESKLQNTVAGTGVRLIGPNCVGYASFHENFCAIAEPIPLSLRPGGISVISQSGVLTHTALAALADEGLGVDEVYSLGNGAAFGFASALKWLGQRPTTQIICAVVESVTDREAMVQAITVGRKSGKEFIFLLLGQSEDGKRVAASHTGTVIGDQRIMRAWLTDLGVILVNSFDELTRTAALLEVVGRPGPGRGVFILTGSGGAAGLAADTSAAYGLPLAQLTEATEMELRKHLLPGTTVGNPLDTTSHGGPEAVKAIYEAITADPNVGIMVDPVGLSWPDDTDERRWHRSHMLIPVGVAVERQTPLIYSSLMGQPMTDFVAEIAKRDHISVNTGFATTISSLARLYNYDLEPPAEARPSKASVATTDPESTVDEAKARDVLDGLGFPMVAGFVAGSAEAAGAGAADLQAPWVAKISLEGLGHKGRVGGVRLGLCSTEELVAACEDITDKVVSFGIAKRDDVAFMVQEMVFGPEILVGLVRDEVAGPAVIIGVGGWAAESANIFAAIPLPADRGRIASKLYLSQLPKLIGAANTDGLVDLLVTLGIEFTTGGLSDYAVVECNPVIMAAGGPQIADALLIKRESASQRS